MTSLKLATALIAVLVLGSPQDPEPRQVTSDDVPKLAWIVGTWELRDGDKTTVEHWAPHAGTTFMGTSRTPRTTIRSGSAT